jgi:hypothetical protein
MVRAMVIQAVLRGQRNGSRAAKPGLRRASDLQDYQPEQAFLPHEAAMESNHPSGGLPRPAGFEDRMPGSKAGLFQRILQLGPGRDGLRDFTGARRDHVAIGIRFGSFGTRSRARVYVGQGAGAWSRSVGGEAEVDGGV